MSFPPLFWFSLTFAVCIGLSLVLLMLLDRSRRLRRARMARYGVGLTGQTTYLIERRMEERSRAAAQAAAPRAEGLTGLLEVRLREAGIEMEPAAVLVFTLAAAGAVLTALVLFSPLPALLCVPLSLGLAWMGLTVVLDLRRASRVRTFNEALPDCLDVFARGLRSGQPIPMSLGLVAQHARGIAQEEFRQCSEELRLGVSLPDSLRGIATRIDSPEAKFIAVATSLQAETGGNLVETLENLATQLRERSKLRRKAAAMTAEIRVSAVVLGGLPFVVGLVLYVMNPGYLMPLVQDTRGMLMGLAGLVSLGLGILSMHRLSRLDV